MHINPVGDAVLANHHLDMGFILGKPDDLLILAASVRFSRSAEIDRLQYIRLSLSIVPVQNIGSRIKLHVQACVIAVIF